MELIKITADKERAKSIVKMVLLLEERIKMQDQRKMAALIIVDYYEIFKELLTAILLFDGYKTLSHKDLIEYVKKRYTELKTQELILLDDLRILRNRVAYEGFFIEQSYLERNEALFLQLIKTLKAVITKKLAIE